MHSEESGCLPSLARGEPHPLARSPHPHHHPVHRCLHRRFPNQRAKRLHRHQIQRRPRTPRPWLMILSSAVAHAGSGVGRYLQRVTDKPVLTRKVICAAVGSCWRQTPSRAGPWPNCRIKYDRPRSHCSPPSDLSPTSCTPTRAARSPGSLLAPGGSLCRAQPGGFQILAGQKNSGLSSRVPWERPLDRSVGGSRSSRASRRIR